LVVAQICNLLYRRIAFGWSASAGFSVGADYKSAIQQNSILRYDGGGAGLTEPVAGVPE
jgi:hypothetical protein